MDSSAVAMTLDRVCGACQLADDSVERSGHWFLKIPPERIGLHGEFDYHGLSKRVLHCLSNDQDMLGHLKVRQRGRVVMLSGRLDSPNQLNKVVSLARAVNGVDEVDARSVVVTGTF